jgi:transcriptional regulator with XRE-family HTH domain
MRNGFSQWKVAQLIGTSQSTYSRFESDVQMPTLNQLQTLAILYNVSVGGLMSAGKEISFIEPSLRNISPELLDETLAACRRLIEIFETEKAR